MIQLTKILILTLLSLSISSCAQIGKKHQRAIAAESPTANICDTAFTGFMTNISDIKHATADYVMNCKDGFESGSSLKRLTTDPNIDWTNSSGSQISKRFGQIAGIANQGELAIRPDFESCRKSKLAKERDVAFCMIVLAEMTMAASTHGLAEFESKMIKHWPSDKVTLDAARKIFLGQVESRLRQLESQSCPPSNLSGASQ